MDKKSKGGPPPPPPGQPMYPGIPGMPPGMMPNTGGRPMVVVMMKGGGNPNLSGLPFMGMMGGPQPPPGGKKKKKKSKGGKKKTKKSGEKKKTKPGEEESDSDSDRMSAPDLPTAHTVKLPGAPGGPGGAAHPPGANGANNGGGNSNPRTPNKSGNKPGAPANAMASTFGGATTTTSTTNNASSTTTSTTSAAGNAPGGAAGAAAGAAAAGGKTPAKKPIVKKAPAKPGVKKENFIIKDGNVDKSCVPMFTLIDGPGGCPIIVPIDARDECAIVPELGPQPLKVAPKETTRGYLVINEDGLLHFKTQKKCKEAPFASTPGQLQKFLTNANIFIADAGPALPDEKAYNKATCTATKDKIGAEIAVSGHIVMNNEKGTCKFTRVAAPQPFPFYPASAAMGVLVKDPLNGYVFWVPTENRFVGPVLAQGVKPTFKPVSEAAIVGNIYKDAAGAATWEVPSDKKDNLMGYIMSSATGVPIYVSKPDDTLVRAATPSKIKKVGAVTPTATSVTGQTASPSPSSPSIPGVAGGATTNPDGTPAAPGAGQTGETGGAAKSVHSVAVMNFGGVQSMACPPTPSSDPAAAAAAAGEGEKKEGEGVQDAFKKMIASQTELPPEPAEAPKEEAKEEQKQEEEAPPPPPPPPPPKKIDANAEYKKFLDDRSSFL
ncbi:hypothetical protein PFISCL1PPCAC_5855 [Pristionchus fissidentatus]|uniref:Uncharacterized protein n=1 Tax=Pristionchus fissidentatus TaxID=1538716 RepID=A0AAV5V8H3_9BILA|nr:hypothetical protein PFISCL1PPCAC_5855 [Pristionchus fissidentatus]